MNFNFNKRFLIQKYTSVVRLSNNGLMTFSLSTVSCHKYVPLGMQNRKIPDNKITASSMFNNSHAPEQARLHYKPPIIARGYFGSWCAKYNRIGQWTQVDLSRVTKVTAVATQGRYDHNQWVTSYTLQHSLQGNRFANVEKGKVFSGNKDRHTVVKHDFSTPVIARYIRLIVKSWYNHICFRMELYGCRYGDMEYMPF